MFQEGLAYCKPCDCVNGICFNYNNTNFPICCEDCDCGFTDVVPGMNIIAEVIFLDLLFLGMITLKNEVQLRMNRYVTPH